jgi:rhamnogalacturonan endolyase
VVREQRKWPYAWVSGVDYPRHEQRSTVSGQLVLKDPLMPNAKMSHLLVSLTYPDYHITTPRAAAGNTPADITWMTDAKHYEFWNRGEDNGKFAINDVRAGNYTLHAIADGVLGEFAKADVVVEPGKPLDLGSLTWTPVRRGKQVWEIGIPNRNGREFFKGDDYFHDGMALVYRDNFPNDVNYVIGKSDYSKDWYFQHVPHVADNAQPNNIGGGGGTGRASPWTITFNLPEAPKSGTATLRVAIAGGNAGGGIPVTVNDQSIGTIRMKDGGDSTVGRNGIQGLWYEREGPFPATLLKAGTNVIQLTVPAGGATSGVIYDYLRLELDESATPPPATTPPATASL